MISQEDLGLIHKLKRYTSRFREIRSRFGMGEHIGFASLPEAHGIYTIATILQAEIKNGTLHYYAHCFLGSDKKTLPQEEKERVLVMPINNGQARIVSIYQRYGPWDGGESVCWFQAGLDSRLLSVNDYVLDGFVAHEFSHVLDENNNTPGDIQKVLVDAEKNLATDLEGLPWEVMDGEYAIDMIAALMGYKTQVLAKLEYVASLLSSYENPISDPFPLISPQLALKGIEFRKRQVEKYCIQ